MSNIPVAFLVLGALFTVYAVAATWHSKDARRHLIDDDSRRRPRR